MGSMSLRPSEESHLPLTPSETIEHQANSTIEALCLHTQLRHLHKLHTYLRGVFRTIHSSFSISRLPRSLNELPYPLLDLGMPPKWLTRRVRDHLMTRCSSTLKRFTFFEQSLD
ncbi:hypothetical protein PMIN06_009831 [Paraphaeosphaeria minitans]|uniref:Uncharacterized protein n=1 Tax=Paraphaeosphaeria minitans TaxID=565426 RepID=A0A9P6G6E2_9PLEO|nr:hypothetical protein PMIN01_12990 [Paraphaeosphaeria minitans]